LEFVGIKDVWSRTEGETGTMINSIQATIDALSETNKKLKVR
jgi:ribosomal protein S5